MYQESSWLEKKNLAIGVTGQPNFHWKGTKGTSGRFVASFPGMLASRLICLKHKPKHRPAHSPIPVRRRLKTRSSCTHKVEFHLKREHRCQSITKYLSFSSFFLLFFGGERENERRGTSLTRCWPNMGRRIVVVLDSRCVCGDSFPFSPEGQIPSRRNEFTVISTSLRRSKLSANCPFDDRRKRGR